MISRRQKDVQHFLRNFNNIAGFYEQGVMTVVGVYLRLSWLILVCLEADVK